LKDRLLAIQKRIAAAAHACGRDPLTVRLVAVSKTMPADVVRQAIEAGAGILGENYVQEAREKFDILNTYDVAWHFIGHLQSNKAKYVVRIFDLIHSVDSLKLVKELDKQARKVNKVQPILIQVNIALEGTKSGVAPNETLELIETAAQYTHVSIKGLMTMPPFFNSPEKVRPYFAALRALSRKIDAHNIPNVSMQELSMGMTGDFEAAIEEGATYVRVGTAIFGERY
jgi:pyridoxal phosphate enzyme (YggS family)